MSASSLRPVLLIEDSPDDAEFTRRAFARCKVSHPLIVAEEPQQAIALLTGAGRSGNRLEPALILLDLNLPGCGGRELLERIKSDKSLRTIPLVVLSTSSQDTDVERCYRLGANSYHPKPTSLREFEETIRQIASYWLSAALPLPAIIQQGAVLRAAAGLDTTIG